MSDERMLGELIGEFREHKRHTAAALTRIEKDSARRFDRIEKQISKIASMGTVKVSTIATIVAAIVAAIMKH